MSGKCTSAIFRYYQMFHIPHLKNSSIDNLLFKRKNFPSSELEEKKILTVFSINDHHNMYYEIYARFVNGQFF